MSHLSVHQQKLFLLSITIARKKEEKTVAYLVLKKLFSFTAVDASVLNNFKGCGSTRISLENINATVPYLGYNCDSSILQKAHK